MTDKKSKNIFAIGEYHKSVFELIDLQKSESVYHSTQMLYKLIFSSAAESHIIKESPCNKLSAKGGIPPKEKHALTDERAQKSLRRFSFAIFNFRNKSGDFCDIFIVYHKRESRSFE